MNFAKRFETPERCHFPVSPQDMVALATADLKKGETVVVDGQSIVLLDDIPNAHKIALNDF